MILSLIAQDAPQTGPVWLYITLGLISSGLFTTGLQWWGNRKKTDSDTDKVDAETNKIIQETTRELLEDMRNQVKDSEAFYIKQQKLLTVEIEGLRKEVEKIPELEERIVELTQGIELLINQIKDAGMTPAYPPMPPNVS